MHFTKGRHLQSQRFQVHKSAKASHREILPSRGKLYRFQLEVFERLWTFFILFTMNLIFTFAGNCTVELWFSDLTKHQSPSSSRFIFRRVRPSGPTDPRSASAEGWRPERGGAGPGGAPPFRCSGEFRGEVGSAQKHEELGGCGGFGRFCEFQW